MKEDLGLFCVALEGRNLVSARHRLGCKPMQVSESCLYNRDNTNTYPTGFRGESSETKQSKGLAQCLVQSKNSTNTSLKK